MNDKVIHEDAEGKVFSSKALVADGTAFGPLDVMQPNARLNTLIDTARTFRAQNPERSVMSTELAVNEVLKLRAESAKFRKEIGSLTLELDINRDRVIGTRRERDHARDMAVHYQGLYALAIRPWYVKLLERVRVFLEWVRS